MLRAALVGGWAVVGLLGCASAGVARAEPQAGEAVQALARGGDAPPTEDTPEQWAAFADAAVPALDDSALDDEASFEAFEGTTAAIATTGPDIEATTGGGNKAALGQRIAWTTRRWVGLKSLRRVSRSVPDDCSGLVRLAYRRYGLDVMDGPAYRGDNGVTIIWRQAKARGAVKMRTARPGDVVFFRNTHDRNGDGRRNDGLTHIGIVESVQKNGTVTFIHRSGSGVVRGRLNLRHPHLRADRKGNVLNDYIRRPDATKGPRLAGALFAGFASPHVFKGSGRYAQR